MNFIIAHDGVRIISSDIWRTWWLYRIDCYGVDSSFLYNISKCVYIGAAYTVHFYIFELGE